MTVLNYSDDAKPKRLLEGFLHIKKGLLTD